MKTLILARDAADTPIAINLDAVQFIQPYDAKMTKIWFTCGRDEYVVVNEPFDKVIELFSK